MVALLVVDVQNDFVEGGALTVKGGRAIIPRINRLIERLGGDAFIVYTMDWHPPHHSQFSPHGGPWPVHCVQGTTGAELVPELHRPGETQKKHEVLRKGQHPQRDGYSAFEATNAAGHSLEQILKKKGIQTIFICGLTTEYCVQATALDAKKAGMHVHVIRNAVAGIEPQTTERAIAEMQAAGVEFHQTADGIAELLPKKPAKQVPGKRKTVRKGKVSR
ncbi:MAG TPA: nicotinamidase [Terriglobales bacterium]|nr:nicotinamidase [Terriglobales bacterium]